MCTAEYHLSEKQTEALLDITLRRLTSFEVGFCSITFYFCCASTNEVNITLFVYSMGIIVFLHFQRKKFVDEHNSLTQQISKLNELLLSKKLIFQVFAFFLLMIYLLLRLLMNVLSSIWKIHMFLRISLLFSTCVNYIMHFLIISWITM